MGIVVVTFSPIINNTPETLGKAMLYALLRVVVETYPDKPSARRGVLLALLFCSLALLKTSYLPAAVAVVVTFYGVSALAGLSWKLVAEGASSGAVVFVALLPWMLVSYAIAETFWYPLLGTGTLGDAEVAGFTRLEQFIKDGGRIAFILAPACATAAWIRMLCVPLASRALLVALPFTFSALALATQLKFTLFGYRYGHMGASTVFLFYLPYALVIISGRSRMALLQGAAHVMVLVILCLNNTLGYRWFNDGLLGQASIGQPLSQNPLVALSGKAQQYQLAVPSGKPLLALVSWPSLLDFRRNRISVMDWPGMIGPPGMPALTDDVAWRQYLTKAGIDYVAYSYGDEAGFTEQHIAQELTTFSSADRFSQFQLRLDTNFQSVKRMFLIMRRCSNPVFDDGTVAVFTMSSIAPECLRHSMQPA